MWIGISRNIKPEEIESELKGLYPGYSVGVLDDLAALSNDKESWPEIVATLDNNKSEFPLVIHFLWWPKSEPEPDVFNLAKIWGSSYCCKTIVDGSDYGDDKSPFWSVIFDSGKYYLADDCNSVFGDDETGNGPVRVVREIHPKT